MFYFGGSHLSSTMKFQTTKLVQLRGATFRQPEFQTRNAALRGGSKTIKVLPTRSSKTKPDCPMSHVTPHHLGNLTIVE